MKQLPMGRKHNGVGNVSGEPKAEIPPPLAGYHWEAKDWKQSEGPDVWWYLVEDGTTRDDGDWVLWLTGVPRNSKYIFRAGYCSRQGFWIEQSEYDTFQAVIMAKEAMGLHIEYNY